MEVGGEDGGDGGDGGDRGRWRRWQEDGTAALHLACHPREQG